LNEKEKLINSQMIMIEKMKIQLSDTFNQKINFIPKNMDEPEENNCKYRI
jgi:hypothetical protein